jgi:hypothetical protein
MCFENVTTQPPAIGVTHMINPALHAGVQFGETDLPGLVQINVVFQAMSGL